MQICLVKWEVVKKSPMIIWRERAHYQPPTRPSLKFFDNCFPEMTSRARILALKRFLFGSQGFSSWDLYEINSKIRFFRWALGKLRILSTQRKYHSNNLTFNQARNSHRKIQKFWNNYKINTSDFISKYGLSKIY